MPSTGSTRRSAGPTRFNEAAGADPADASSRQAAMTARCWRFNEAAGADPADAWGTLASRLPLLEASMRPRGQTPRMRMADSSLRLMNTLQ